MAKIINPFIVTGKIAPEYFCDRVSESARLVKSVTNGNNLVVISPRRMGKTGLIQLYFFHRYSAYVKPPRIYLSARPGDLRNTPASQS